jgi:hypothetical protein
VINSSILYWNSAQKEPFSVSNFQLTLPIAGAIQILIIPSSPQPLAAQQRHFA